MKVKISEGSKVYNREKLNLLESYGPKIRPCKICGYPTIDGYVCTYCGGDDSITITPLKGKDTGGEK